MCVEKPSYYYSKNIRDASVDEMNTFAGLRIYMAYLCMKLSYQITGQVTFFHVVYEQDVNIDKMNTNTEYCMVGIFSTISSNFI